MVVPMSGGQTEKQVQLIRDFEPKIILVTPSYMLNLIDEMVRQGMDPAESSLKIGIFGAEPWTQALREEVETRVGIDALDIYGLSEVMAGRRVRMRRDEGRPGDLGRPFLSGDHRPGHGRSAADGSQGELVFTSLTKEAMPVIRYRTRDLTALLPPTARAMRRLAKITGRSDDMLIVRGVNVFPSQIEEIVVALPQLSGQFQITLSRDGHMDRLDLAVELRSEAAASVSESDRAALARELQHRIKTMVGVSSGVTVLAAGGIPATATGKARRVIDRRQAA